MKIFKKSILQFQKINNTITRTGITISKNPLQKTTIKFAEKLATKMRKYLM